MAGRIKPAAFREVWSMATTFVAALITGGSMAVVLFGGVVSAGALTGEALSLALAATTVLAVLSAAALDS
jgi:hypothetical protein